MLQVPLLFFLRAEVFFHTAHLTLPLPLLHIFTTFYTSKVHPLELPLLLVGGRLLQQIVVHTCIKIETMQLRYL